jgi:hypothetical protein
MAGHRHSVAVVCYLMLSTSIGFAKQPSKATLEIISVCSAGYSIALDAGVQVEVADVAEGRVKGSVQLAKRLQGAFMTLAKVSEERAVELYRSYINCVQAQRSVAELLAILRQRHDKIATQLSEDGLNGELDAFRALYARYVEEIQANQRVAAHETGREIQTLLIETELRSKNSSFGTSRYVFSKSQSNSKELSKQSASASQGSSKTPKCVPRTISIQDVEFEYLFSMTCVEDLVSPQ